MGRAQIDKEFCFLAVLTVIVTTKPIPDGEVWLSGTVSVAL